MCQPEMSSSNVDTDILCSVYESNQRAEEFQETKMNQCSESGRSESDVMRTPSTCGEVPSPVMEKVRCAMEVGRKDELHNHEDMFPMLVRSDPPARVCLEKRFDGNPCDMSRQQASQAVVVNAFLSVLHSTDMQGIAIYTQSENSLKEGHVATVESPYTCGGEISNIIGPSHGQGHKHPEVIDLKNVTFNKADQTAESVLQHPYITHLDTADKHHLVKKENKAAAKGTTKKGGGRTAPSIAIIERRERHNSQERDRRRRIRLCCDELNMLVPFCYSDTDRATTLQWTTAFLKYIKDTYGDSLKQEFESTFVSKACVQIKPCETAVHHFCPCKDIPEHNSSFSS